MFNTHTKHIKVQYHNIPGIVIIGNLLTYCPSFAHVSATIYSQSSIASSQPSVFEIFLSNGNYLTHLINYFVVGSFKPICTLSSLFSFEFIYYVLSVSLKFLSTAFSISLSSITISLQRMDSSSGHLICTCIYPMHYSV